MELGNLKEVTLPKSMCISIEVVTSIDNHESSIINEEIPFTSSLTEEISRIIHDRGIDADDIISIRTNWYQSFFNPIYYGIPFKVVG